ncbi:MAG: CaiB/BaiF CoA transferase family protein [Thalassospira sp.]|uniref:CaiB/BaiF CoA transferase family protein n=1 Tax=Thalassospira sp. TaxID=1912094 RepID=UPI003A8B28D1
MQAFDGIRVLDLTHVLAGPFSTYQLAVLGADVIKIESPLETDMNRQIGPVQELNDALMGTHYQAQGINKRAMTLNLKTRDGRAIFLKLAEGADVIVENFRSGAMARLGLGYDDIRKIKPDIIYCSITGYGQTGPRSSYGAFDNVIQAFSGVMSATGDQNDPPTMIGPPMLDYGTGIHAAFAISTALLRRERTGEGQYLDVAMLDAALMMMSCNVLNATKTEKPPGRSRDGRDFVAAYGCYRASDADLMIGIFTPKQHARLWRAIGRNDLAIEVEQQRIRDMPARRENDKEVLRRTIATKTAEEWEVLLNEAGVPSARIRTIVEAVQSQQVKSRSLLGEWSVSVDGGAPAVAAFSCSEDGPRAVTSAPRVGQHTHEVLSELGFCHEEISAFINDGVV